MTPVPRQGWPLAVAVVAAFAVGATAGGYWWSVRDGVNGVSSGELIAGPVTRQESSVLGGESSQLNGLGAVAESAFTLSASVFNAGDNDVTVVDARPAGWTVAASPPETRIPAGEWASIPLTISPDCAQAAPDPELELQLGAESADQRVTVPMFTRGGSTFGSFWLLLCSPAGLGAVLNDIEIISEDGGVEMRITLRQPSWRADDVAVDHLGTNTGAFRAAASDLPLRVAPGETEATTLRWSVADCAALSGRLGSIDLVMQAQGSAETLVPLPGRAVAALTRLGVQSCSE